MIVGVAALSAGSYSAASTATKTETRAKKLKKALEACKKDKRKRANASSANTEPGRTLEAPSGLSAAVHLRRQARPA